MNSIISFKDVDISVEGTIQCNVSKDGDSSKLFFRLPYSFQPATDLVATAFAYIAGNAFEQVHIELPIGSNLLGLLRSWTGSYVVAKQGVDIRRRVSTEIALNFSGGFDSTAAEMVLQKPHLVSLDFGGKFSRERDFYEQFDPFIVETNLVDIGLNSFSSEFMGIGSLLMRDELELGAHAFGNIMGASAADLVHGPLRRAETDLALDEYFGMTQLNPVAGLSEVGAMSLVALRAPRQLDKILASVALPQEEKYLRKYLTLLAVDEKYDLDLNLPKNEPARPAGLQWGQSHASDLATLYAMTVLGVDKVLTYMPQGVPSIFLDFISQEDVEFMSRINPHAYREVPRALLPEWYFQILSSGLLPYERNDWDAYSRLMELFKSQASQHVRTT